MQATQSTTYYVVVRLPRPMEGNGVTSIFRSLQNCQFHHSRVVGTFNVLDIYPSEHYGLSFLDLTDATYYQVKLCLELFEIIALWMLPSTLFWLLKSLV